MLEFIHDNVIDVKQVLTEMLESGDGKMKVRLLKVINKATGHESTTLYQFSSQNWNSKTTAYKLSINRRGPKFIQDVFTEAHRRRNQKPGNTDISPSEANGSRGDVDPRSLLCIFSFVSHCG